MTCLVLKWLRVLLFRVVKELEPKELTIPGKTDLKLQCKITGYPMPKIKWMRDGNEIKVRKGVIVAQDASGGATLVIEKAQVSKATALARPGQDSFVFFRFLMPVNTPQSAPTKWAQLKLHASFT